MIEYSYSSQDNISQCIILNNSKHQLSLFLLSNIPYVAREMYPLSPGGRIYFMNYQLVRYIPLFQFDKFNRILIIRKTKKFEIVIYTT